MIIAIFLFLETVFSPSLFTMYRVVLFLLIIKIWIIYIKTLDVNQNMYLLIPASGWKFYFKLGNLSQIA